MRKFWVALLALVVALSLAAAVGCGSKKSSSSSTSGSSGSLTATEIAAKSNTAMAAVKSATVTFDVSATINADLSKADAQTKAALSGPLAFTGTVKAAQTSASSSKVDMTMAAKFAGQTFDVGLKVDGKNGWLSFMKQWYALPPGSLNQLSSPAPGASSAAGGIGAQLGTLGINLKTWVKGRNLVGEETLDGTSVYHVSYVLDTAAIGKDLATLAQTGLAMGGSTLGASAAPNSLKDAQALTTALQNGLKDVKCDMWYEKDNSYLRKVVISATLDVSSDPSAAKAGIKGGSFTATVTLGDFNAPVTVTPPASSQPFSKLLGGLSALTGGASL